MREIAETIVSVFEKGYDLKKTIRQTNRSSGWNGTPVVRFNQSKKSNTVLERGVTTETRWRGALHLYSRSRFFLTYYVDHVLRIFAHFSFDSRRGGEEGKKKEKRRRKKKKKEKCFEHGGKKILRLIESLSSFQNDNLWKTCNNTWQHFYYNTYSGLSIILDPGGKKTGGF